MKVYKSSVDKSLRLVWFNEVSDRPNLVSYLAMRQDYSPDPIYLKYEQFKKLSEDELGEKVYRLALKFNHFGIMEHSGLIFNIVGFPHDVPMQHRTHRVGCSFDVMSQRYTGKHFLEIFEANQSNFPINEVEKYFYFPPIGTIYQDREGNKMEYNDLLKSLQLNRCQQAIEGYCRDLQLGLPCEVARRGLPQGIRQHYIFSCNPRSLEHLLDVRTPKDVQSDFRILSALFMEFYEDFNPYLAQKYRERRYQKNKLAP